MYIEDKTRQFTYGIVQKWVNMTMKSLCVIKSVFDFYTEKTILKFLDTLEEELHIPVDGYILEAAILGETVKIKGKNRTFDYGLNLDVPPKEKKEMTLLHHTAM